MFHIMRYPTLGLVSLATALLFISVDALNYSRCYLRDGTSDEDSKPCNPDTGHSHCCRISSHICLSNNLCFGFLYNHVVEGIERLKVQALLLAGNFTLV
jgi:hypothetical protein